MKVQLNAVYVTGGGTMIPKNYVSGEYAVGTEVFTVVDGERKEQLGNKEGTRKISVRMYYPVSKAEAL